MTEPLPTINKAYSSVIQEEKPQEIGDCQVHVFWYCPTMSDYVSFIQF